jgi:DNA-binding transcriptional LysR family regulator
VTLCPTFEVEFQTAAVEMAAHGVGDSLVSYLVTQWQGYPRQLHWSPLEPAFDEHFALITRQSRSLSPATRAFMSLAERHIRALQVVADAGRGA